MCFLAVEIFSMKSPPTASSSTTASNQVVVYERQQFSLSRAGPILINQTRCCCSQPRSITPFPHNHHRKERKVQKNCKSKVRLFNFSLSLSHLSRCVILIRNSITKLCFPPCSSQQASSSACTCLESPRFRSVPRGEELLSHKTVL